MSEDWNAICYWCGYHKYQHGQWFYNCPEGWDEHQKEFNDLMNDPEVTVV